MHAAHAGREKFILTAFQRIFSVAGPADKFFVLVISKSCLAFAYIGFSGKDTLNDDSDRKIIDLSVLFRSFYDISEKSCCAYIFLQIDKKISAVQMRDGSCVHYNVRPVACDKIRHQLI